MSDETLKKADKDYSTELDTALPELEALGASNLDAALDKLYAYEKKVRQASDLTSAKRVLVVIVKLLANPHSRTGTVSMMTFRCWSRSTASPSKVSLLSCRRPLICSRRHQAWT